MNRKERAAFREGMDVLFEGRNPHETALFEEEGPRGIYTKVWKCTSLAQELDPVPVIGYVHSWGGEIEIKCPFCGELHRQHRCFKTSIPPCNLGSYRVVKIVDDYPPESIEDVK